MTERWTRLEEFPDYSVSTYGQVASDRRDIILRQTLNLQGIPMVNLKRDGRPTTRSVPLLVASAFIPNPDPARFNSPIQLNGHRIDSHVDNLMWRPRWFAIKYHNQFHIEDFYYVPQAEILLLETDEVFKGFVDPSTKYGLHYRDIMFSYMNRHRVFPTNQQFRLI